MTKLSIVFGLFIFFSTTSCWSEDLAGTTQEPFRKLYFGNKHPVAVLPQIESERNVYKDFVSKDGKCELRPDVYGDLQLVYDDGVDFSDNSIPQEIFNVITDKDNDSCPEKLEIHKYSVTCKKEDGEFNLHIVGNFKPFKYDSNWKMQISKGKIRQLQYDSKTYSGKEQSMTHHVNCGDSLTS